MKAQHLGADCDNCPLRSAAYVPTKYPQGQPQLGEGAKKIAVVGEAPGFYEATFGQPFTGPSGKLLNTILQHHGIERNEVLLTNVTLCRPTDNATPSKDAVAACSGRLARELAEWGATDVLALGGTAGTLLVADTGTITTLRIGPAKSPSRLLTNNGVASTTRVVASWHPAYCLRNADAFPALVTDVGKLFETNAKAWREPEWHLADEEEPALDYIKMLQGLDQPIMIDIETGLDKDVDFDHPNNYDILCVGIAYGPDSVIVIGEEALKFDSVRASLKKLLQTKKLIAQNGKYDLSGLFPLFGALELWFDTMLAHYALDERPGGHGLDVMAIELLGSPDWKAEIKKYVPRRGNYANIPRPILYKYNALDCANTWRLYEVFDEQLERTGMRHVHDFLVKAANQLMFLELNGIALDKDYSNQLMNEYIERLDVIEQELDDIVRASTGHLEDGPLLGINPRSPMQVKKYLESQGVKVASTNEATLTAVLPRLREGSSRRSFVETLLRYRRQHKLYSTYIVGIRKRAYRGRVYTTYMLHGTTSGRLASRNPNLQNIVRDKEIRRQFSVSRPGNVLIQADYKQAEARVMTFLAQDEYLREILSRDEEGYDFFNELSDQLYGAGKWGKEQRIRTKAFFYGIGYGREAFSIGKEYGLTPVEAQKAYDDFTNLIPGIVAWQESIKRTVLSGRPLQTPFGRRRHFFLITDQNKKDVLNEALSYLPQSTASDICLSALIRVRPLLRGLGFLRLTIHDALVAECAEEKQEEVSNLLREVMADEGRKFTGYLPFPVDISVGKSWGEL